MAEVGEKLYRFKFDFETGTMSVDKFTITEARNGGRMVKACPDGSNPDTTLFGGISFSSNHLNEVKSSKQAKYVLLDHDDETEACRLIHEFVMKQLETAEDRVAKLSGWHGQLCEWEAHI